MFLLMFFNLDAKNSLAVLNGLKINYCSRLICDVQSLRWINVIGWDSTNPGFRVLHQTKVKEFSKIEKFLHFARDPNTETRPPNKW